MIVAGLGLPFPTAKVPPLDGSLAATVYVAGAAVLTLKVAPNLTPDQLETLITDPRVLLDRDGTRDGLGLPLTAQVVSLARDAKDGKIELAEDRSRFVDSD
jgi:hypothetical protein